MNLPPFLLQRRSQLVIGVTVLLLLFILLLQSCGGEKTVPPSVIKEQHLDYIVRLLQSYYQRHGAYPLPTMQRETLKGIENVWGYKKNAPAYASCTIAVYENDAVDAYQSSCGGDVYDIDGNVVGWKGTIALSSGFNSIEEENINKIDKPLKDLTNMIPMDPQFANDPTLVASGFGEYVYAVRRPENGDTSRGAQEYQLAMTVQDPTSGEKYTVIRGNYFVRSSEKSMPLSLIGAGVLTDKFGRLVYEQDQAIHVLIDGQKEGFPNPILGEGEIILNILSLKRSTQTLLDEAMKRSETLQIIDPKNTKIQSVLQEMDRDLSDVIKTLHLEEVGAAERIESGEAILQSSAVELEKIMDSFISKRIAETETALQSIAKTPEEVITGLRNVLRIISNVHEEILLARDEIVRYLDGYGIEEQSRNRAMRKIANAQETIPDFQQTLHASGTQLPLSFITEVQQQQLDDLLQIIHLNKTAFGTKATTTGSTLSGATIPATPTLDTVSTNLITIGTEIGILLSDLDLLLSTIEEDIENPAMTMEEIDNNLRKLTKALNTEIERIETLFSNITDPTVTQRALDEFRLLMQSGRALEAVRKAAEFSSFHGNFFALPFPASSINEAKLEKAPGLPDIELYDDPLMAEYKGIPYPLP